MSSITPKIQLIAAMGNNRVIGKEGQLPWRLPNDLQFFKQKTLRHPVILGRKTFDSFGARPLPDRPHIVLSRQTMVVPDGVTLAHSWSEAKTQALAISSDIFVIGGEQIYEMALVEATDLWITRVDVTLDGDAYFPDWDDGLWRCIDTACHLADERHAYDYCFEHYQRVG